MRAPLKIALAGGIGSGKSTVARVISILGFPVYDCDARAKALVDNSPAIIAEIGSKVCAEAVMPDGTLNRPALAAAVFSDPEALQRLNAIVHHHVRRDIAAWVAAQHSSIVFIETAILYESGLDRMVDAVWEVTAPAEVRVARVLARNGLTPAQVLQRIQAQDSFEPVSRHQNVSVIVNDGIHSLLPQVLSRVKSL